jgi:tetratricopeptide (TPR) repeat protein/DNA-binding NarL/FixJ family response regulator
MVRVTKPALPPLPRQPIARPAPKAITQPLAKRGAQEPTVLLVGAGDALEQALATALARHHVYVETAPKDGVVENVVAAAPDLVLLAGETAKDCGSEALKLLASSPMSSVVPVAILEDDPALDARLRAFRHGAAAVIPRSASIDAIADQVARVAREIPERGGESLGVVGEATLHDFVQTLGSELRSGILSVSAGDAKDAETVRLVLGRGRPLADFIDDFVKRVRRHVVHAEPLRWEFDERAGGTVELFGGEEEGDESDVITDVKDLRVLLADGDSARADSVAQELRTQGASVAVTDLEPTEARFLRLRQADPAILLIGEADVNDKGYELLRRMRRDTRLRWASLLVVRWDEVWSDRSAVPAIGRLAGTVAALAEPERAIRARAESGQPFDTRLEIVGPARCLRALASCDHALRVNVHNPRVRIELDLSEGLVVGATGHVAGETPGLLEGPAALAALLVLSSGRVHVEPVAQPHTANLMSTVDVALNLADVEPAPIPPSLPSPAGSLPPPALPSMRPPPAFGSELDNTDQAGRGPLESALTFMPRRRSMLWIAAAAALVAAISGGVLFFGSRTKPSTKKQSPSKAVATASVQATGASSAPAPQTKAAPSAEPAASAAASTPAEEPDAEAAIATAIDLSGTSCESVVKSGEEQRFRGAANDALNLGRREIVKGDLEAAHRAYCRAVSYDPNSNAAVIGLARVLLMRRDGAAAVKWVKKALVQKPDDSNLKALLGDSLARIGDEEGARKAWMASVGIASSHDPEVRALALRDGRLAAHAFDRREWARAERLYRRAAVLDPTSSKAAAGVAKTLLVLDEPASAFAWARRATRLGPKNPDAHLVLGDALRAKNDEKSAEAAYRTAQKLGSPQAERRLRRK